MKPLVISFSGGKTSQFMTVMLSDYYADREKVIVFANTGLEHPETLDFVNACDKRWNLNVVWVEADIQPEMGQGTKHKVVTYETASRNGEPFKAMIKKFGIPNIAFPHCTRELKRRAIRSFAKNELGWTDYETAIGIRFDEQHRINRTEAEKEQWIYPLTDLAPVDERMVLEWHSQQPVQLKIEQWEGNCRGCFKKSDRKLVKAIQKTKGLLDWHDQIEREYSTMKSIEPYYFFRGNRSAKEMMELAAIASMQGELFPLSDVETDCMCKAS